MIARNYFPLGRALGKAFCNREEETQWLTSNILHVKHSLLIAPRRFGKSSLAEIAANKTKLPFIIVNFNTCADEKNVEELIRKNVGLLIGKALGSVDRLIQSIKNYVGNLSPQLNVSKAGVVLELAAKKQAVSAGIVEETLLLLEKLLAEKKKRAIMIFDEFQMVGLIAKGKGVEAAIRNAAQDMQHLTLVFSGSHRRLLQAMFEDEQRPLYKICRKLALGRIEARHYQKHLKQAAQPVWKTALPQAVFDRIMELSQRHPYYVNYLCDIVWDQNQLLPTVDKVDEAWQRLIEEESSDINAEIMSLSLNQKKILKYLAKSPDEPIMAAETIQTLGLALSSISGALKVLLEKDVVERTTTGYQIINPVIDFVLRESAL